MNAAEFREECACCLREVIFASEQDRVNYCISCSGEIICSSCMGEVSASG